MADALSVGWAARMAAGTAGWYTVSISLTLFNKWILDYWVPSFSFPIFMTFCHMVLKGLIAAAVRTSPASPTHGRRPNHYRTPGGTHLRSGKSFLGFFPAAARVAIRMPQNAERGGDRCCAPALPQVIKVGGLKVPRITVSQFFRQACPIGASTGLDIAFSNLSFLYITVS